MKLVKQGKGSWQYQLNPIEADLLNSLLHQFPFTRNMPAEITRTDKDPKVAEREKLLNESLAEHRKELQKQAWELLIKKSKSRVQSPRLILNAEQRETLLQILNDIRIGCWVALGKPESMEPENLNQTAQELAQHHLMNLAGYFEHHLIEQE